MRTIDHLSFEELAAAAAGRRIDRLLQDHLQRCPNCQHALTQMKSLQKTWYEVSGADHPSPDDLRAFRDHALSPKEDDHTKAHTDQCTHCLMVLRWIEEETAGMGAEPSPHAVQAVKAAYRRAIRKAWTFEIVETLGKIVTHVFPVLPRPAFGAPLMVTEDALPFDARTGSESRDLADEAPPQAERLEQPHLDPFSLGIERPRRQRPPSERPSHAALPTPSAKRAPERHRATADRQRGAADRDAVRATPPEAGPATPESGAAARPPRAPQRPAGEAQPTVGEPRPTVSEPALIEGVNCVLQAIVQRAHNHRVLLLAAQDRLNQPLPGLELVLEEPSGPFQTVQTDSEGRAVLELPLGHSRLRVPAEPLEVEILLRLER